MRDDTDGFIHPVIGVELEHLAKMPTASRGGDGQPEGAEAALLAINRYTYPNHDELPSFGVSPVWNYYGASPDYCCFPSGGACYDDLSQVEVCTPCTRRPDEAYRYMCAQEYVLAEAVARYLETPVYVWLMNRSRRPNGGMVYRAGHINIAMRRDDLALLTGEAFGQALRAYVPFMIAAGVLLGSGAVGDEKSDEVFLCSQRLEAADTLFPSACTTTNRTLSINLRGFSESLSEDGTAIRNHVIGPQDLTVSPTTELRIALIQAATYALLRADAPPPCDLALVRPMYSALAWNRSPWREQPLERGAGLNALDVAEAGCEAISTTLERDPDAQRALPDWPRYREWMERIIAALRERDLEGSGVEWAAKRVAFADRCDPQDAIGLDILWHELMPELFTPGAAHIARDFGHAPPFDRCELERSFRTPPEDTRAYLRGHLVQRCSDAGEDVSMVNWDGLNLLDRKLRVSMPLPLGSTKAELGPLEGLSLDEILEVVEPQTGASNYRHRSRLQHHSRGGQAVRAVCPEVD